MAIFKKLTGDMSAWQCSRSWVRDPKLSLQQQENRASLLHAGRCGVVSKVTLRHAPDVGDFLKACGVMSVLVEFSPLPTNADSYFTGFRS